MIGAGDVLGVHVWREPTLSGAVKVRPDGYVTLPLVNEVPVVGLTTGRSVALYRTNLHVREQQAIGTKAFMNAEAERLKRELEEQEALVNRYKSAHRFELSGQLDSNLRSLEQLRRELDSASIRLLALQERRGILQKQLVEYEVLAKEEAAALSTAAAAAGFQQTPLQRKQKELESLLQKYSNPHLNVLRLTKEIQGLEAALEDEPPPVVPLAAPQARSSPLQKVLQSQMAELDTEIQALRGQQERARLLVAPLQGRIDNTPIRAIELSKISRGYEITLRKCQVLLVKTLESELSGNMEKKQKGEQFHISIRLIIRSACPPPPGR